MLTNNNAGVRYCCLVPWGHDNWRDRRRRACPLPSATIDQGSAGQRRTTDGKRKYQGSASSRSQEPRSCTNSADPSCDTSTAQARPRDRFFKDRGSPEKASDAAVAATGTAGSVSSTSGDVAGRSCASATGCPIEGGDGSAVFAAFAGAPFKGEHPHRDQPADSASLCVQGRRAVGFLEGLDRQEGQEDAGWHLHHSREGDSSSLEQIFQCADAFHAAHHLGWGGAARRGRARLSCIARLHPASPFLRKAALRNHELLLDGGSYRQGDRLCERGPDRLLILSRRTRSSRI